MRRMLTAEEAAHYCGFSSVNGFQSHVQVAPVKFGRNVRYDVKEIDRFLDNLSHPAPARSFAEMAGNASARGGH